MKKTKHTTKIMLALVAGAVALGACSGYDDTAASENGDEGAKLVTLTACQEGSGCDTRASVDGTSIKWQEGDQIKVFSATEAKTYRLSGGAGTTAGSFTGEQMAGAAYALYPNQDDATVSGNVITAEAPMTQTATPGSFDPKAALMVGTVSEENVEFKNVMSYVKVTVPEDMPICRQITLKAKDEWITLSGKVKITVGENPTWAETDAKEGQAFVRLVPRKGEAYLTENTTYYIAVLPQTTTYGFEVIYNVDDDIYCRQTTKDDDVSKQFLRNKVKNIGSLSTAEGQYTYHVERVTNELVPFAMASFNIGATSSDNSSRASYGDYFAWGALRPAYTSKPTSDNMLTALYWAGGFNQANAPYYDSSDYYNGSYTKYTDGQTLESTDDIASMLWGGKWRMPTKEELDVIKNNSDFTSLLPQAGNCGDAVIYTSGGHYSSSTAKGSRYLHYLHVSKYFIDVGENARNAGLSIRPVLVQD